MPERATPARWSGIQLGALLAMLMGAPSLVTFALGALGPLIVAELELSRTAFGLISTFVSSAAILGSIALGRLVDRIEPRSIGYVSLGVSAVTLVGLGVAPTYIFLVGLAILTGLNQAISNPLTNTLIAQQPSGRPLGVLMGVKQSGVQMAQFAVGASLPWLATLLGWRMSTAVALVPILIAAVLLGRTLDRRQPATPTPAGKQRRQPGRADRPLLVLCVYTFLLAISVQPVNLYLPLYAVESGLLGAAAAGSTVGLVGAVGVAARISIGRAASGIAIPSRLLMPLGVTAGIAFLILAAAEGRSALLLWAAAALFAASALAGNVVIMLTVLSLTRSGGTGRASGLVSAAMFLGFASGPVAFGAIVDATERYPLAWWLLAGSCIAAALVGARLPAFADPGDGTPDEPDTAPRSSRRRPDRDPADD